MNYTTNYFLVYSGRSFQFVGLLLDFYFKNELFLGFLFRLYVDFLEWLTHHESFTAIFYTKFMVVLQRC